MVEPLLTPEQQQVAIVVLAAILLAVSLTGLWLCRRLHWAYEHLAKRQREETSLLLHATVDPMTTRGHPIGPVPVDHAKVDARLGDAL